MKKLSLFVTLFLGLAAAAHAQFEGMGWDGDNNELVARIGLGGYNHLEGGFSFAYDNDADGDAQSNITASGRFLLALHSWEKLTGYLHAGVYFRDDSNGSNKGSLVAKVGYQPEVVLIPHVAVSVLFGAAVQMIPDASVATFGNRISIVDGLNFRILF
jgi:hypothetical protein